jgi:hypothetical protein
MAMRRLSIALAAIVLGAVGWSGVAAAADEKPKRGERDHRAFCHRLADTAQQVRAKIGQIQSVQERIRAKLASGELTPEQEARAKHALRKLEAWQQELEERLERMLDVYAEKCTR